MKVNQKVRFVPWQFAAANYMIVVLFFICILGKFEQIAGVKCYVATPKGDYSKDKVILYMLDAFGLSLQNNLVCVLILYTWEELLAHFSDSELFGI